MQPTGFEIPEQMREVADRSVSQARQAVEQFLHATEKAVAEVEGSAKSVGAGAAEVSRRSLAFLEANIAASFDLAERLVKARTVEEMAAIQQDFLARQMAAAAEQGRELGAMVGRVAGEAAQKNRPK